MVGKQPFSRQSYPVRQKIFSDYLFTKGKKTAIIAWLKCKCTGGSMDRASDSGSEGWGFESLPACQKRSDFCLPKVTSFFIQAAGLAYHHDAVVYIISPFGAVSHHASACISLRLDEMQHCVLMICNSCGIDDIQGFA